MGAVNRGLQLWEEEDRNKGKGKRTPRKERRSRALSWSSSALEKVGPMVEQRPHHAACTSATAPKPQEGVRARAPFREMGTVCKRSAFALPTSSSSLSASMSSKPSSASTANTSAAAIGRPLGGDTRQIGRAHV